MRDWIFKPNRRNRLVDWWALDAWVDSSIYALWAKLKDAWAAYSNFFGRFHVSGARKVFAELGSEGATLFVLGLTVLLAFAIPAIDATNKAGWRTASQYSVTFLDRYGKEIGKRGILFSDAVPLEEIPDHLIKAVLATEDRRFFDHFGLDVLGTFRALRANIEANDVVQGGSSLSQQLAKNLFLSSERSLERKINEAFLALWLEARLTKREILKLYLDRAYLGGGTFGVEAASQFYFGKSVRDINLAEAAVLAGLFKAPSRFAPHNNRANSLSRANTVLTNMVDAGFMTEGQVHGARLNPAQVVDRSDHSSPDYFLDYAFDDVQKLMAGKDEYVLVARTTVDPELQNYANEAVKGTLDRYGRSRRTSQGALVSMETDGAVRAIVGGRDYGESQFNRATRAKRQPGSSFKPYVYLTALQNGYTPRSRVVDGPVHCGRWSPKNYSGGYRGAMTLEHALAKSINTIAVKLSLEIGRDKVLENIEKVGITGPRKSCSMALGDTGITPLSHTAGMAHFASGGKRVRPYAISEIRTETGELVYDRDRDEPEPPQIFERETVETLNRMLKTVVEAGTGGRARLEFTHVSGKTGTSSSYRDAWFMGFTGKYVTGVWFGNDSYRPTSRVTGGNLPAMTWKDYMQKAHANYDIPTIPGLEPHPVQVEARQRTAEREAQDPTLLRQNPSSRSMPEETRAMLENLITMFDEAAEAAEDQEAKAPQEDPSGSKQEARL
ncbi:MAG: transglycosylase domain-containing protein [Dichotomicrobium sp.]